MSRAVLLSVVILTCLQTGIAHDVQNGTSQFVNDTASQVMRGILPTLKELQGIIRSFKNDLNSLNETVSNVEENQSRLSAKIDTLDSKLDSVKENMKKKFNNVKSQLKEYKQQTASELAVLQGNVTSQLAGLQSKFDALLTCQYEQLSDKMDLLNASARERFSAMKGHIQQTAAELQSNVASELAGLRTSLQSNTHSEQLTQLCEKVNMLINDTSRGLSGLNDSINRISDNVEAENSCGHLFPIHTCGGTGGWRRVVYSNFTDPNTNCPSGWQLTSLSKRTCGRVNTANPTCDSVIFSVGGGDYTRVCGRIIGYQNGSTTAFEHFSRTAPTIDGPYVDGVSLTHGSPRQHIWTFVAGRAEYIVFPQNVLCSCDTTYNVTIPPFVGGDYFCESGHNSRPFTQNNIFYPDDPIWDGDGCTYSSRCCSFNNPPYFTKILPNPTSDDIEARLCSTSYNYHSDTPIEFIELYVR